jgi:hypothetical protein
MYQRRIANACFSRACLALRWASAAVLGLGPDGRFIQWQGLGSRMLLMLALVLVLISVLAEGPGC